MKRSSKMKQKAFFIIFKGLLLKQIKQIFLEGESPILSVIAVKIKQWKPTVCSCTVCQSYTGRVRYIKFSEY